MKKCFALTLATAVTLSIVFWSTTAEACCQRFCYVQGRVTDSNNQGLANVQISLIPHFTAGKVRTTLSDASGDYRIGDVLPGSYTVIPGRSGLSFTPQSRRVTVLVCGGFGPGCGVNGDNINFVAPITNSPVGPFTVSGHVMVDNGSTITPAPSIGVSISNGGSTNLTTATDGAGSYSFVVPGGNYTVQPVLNPNNATPQTRSVAVSADVPNVDFILPVAVPLRRISGYVREANDITPMYEVLVTAGSGRTTKTDVLGYYELWVPVGGYSIRPIMPPTQFVSTQCDGTTSPPDTCSLTIASANVDNQNFRALAPSGPYTITGRVTYADTGNGVSGMTVVAESGQNPTLSAQTDGNGSYTIQNVFDGQYVVRPILGPGQFSDPLQRNIPISGGGVHGVDFEISERQTTSTYSIQGRVHFSDNTGLSGVTIAATLPSAGSRSGVTDSTGNYAVTGLPVGDYQVSAVPVTGYTITRLFANPVTITDSTGSVMGRDFVAACAAGYTRSGATCVPTNILPQSITIAASDGTFTDYVFVQWTPVVNLSNYQLYRSPFPGDLGIPLGTPTTATTFEDRSAVPGVHYFYTVIATLADSNSVQSNTDEGHRPASPGDGDGDGVPDDQEKIDRTNPQDPGSFRLRLRSPIYTKYNTFLNQFNFLELIATGNEPVNATITVFDINGGVVRRFDTFIPAGQQHDIDIHSIVRKIDTYGLVKIEFNDHLPGVSLLGRMSNYRFDPNGKSYSFAFAKELKNATRGPTYGVANSFDPQGRGFLVPNWGEMINLDTKPLWFTNNIYDQSGKLIESRRSYIPALGEFDRQCGHEQPGEGVYLCEFIPDDGAALYLSTLSRYSSNHYSGDEAPTYNFAFALDGKAGTGDAIYAPTSNRSGGCWREQNWVEVANTREKQVAAFVDFRDANGNVLNQVVKLLEPRSQFHFNASALLAPGSRGSVKVSASDPAALIAQSMFYYHDCADNLTQSAYVSTLRIPGQDVQNGTYNTNLGMQNHLLAVGTLGGPTLFRVEVQTSQGMVKPDAFGLGSAAALDLNLNNTSVFGTKADTYGVVTVRTPLPKSAVVEALRVREVEGRIDFIMPTVVQ